MSEREFYSCGIDCNECPEFEDCHNEDGEDCEYLDVNEPENYLDEDDDYALDTLLDQEFEDKISGYDYEVEG